MYCLLRSCTIRESEGSCTIRGSYTIRGSCIVRGCLRHYILLQFLKIVSARIQSANRSVNYWVTERCVCVCVCVVLLRGVF